MLAETYTYWILQAVAIMLTALVLPGMRVTSIFGALITVLLLGLVNATVWDAALFFELPNSFSVHTLVLLLSNAVLFTLLVKVVPGIDIKGITVSLAAPIVFTLFSILIHTHCKDIRWGAFFTQGLSSVEAFRDNLIKGSFK